MLHITFFKNSKALTANEDNNKFTLDSRILPHEQLLDAIKDAVALWTEDRWVRVCVREPGYVYIMHIHTEPFGKELVYRLKGSSEISPPNKIECQPRPLDKLYTRTDFLRL